MDAVNYAFQSVLKAHNFDPRECIIFEELGRRGDQLNGEVAGGWRGSNVHSPICARVPQSAPDLVFQKVWEIDYVPIHCEVAQGTRIWVEVFQQLQTS